MTSSRPLNKPKVGYTQMATRRLNTQTDQIMQPKHLYQHIKSSEKPASKQKYLDVVSKVQFKATSNNSNNFKINPYKNGVGLNRILRTQPDQVNKARKSIVNEVSLDHNKTTKESKYQILGTAGKGTFGVVYMGRDKITGAKIAIKKVLQDKRYKNRQLQILKILKHPNILEMKDHYMSSEGDSEYLNVIMDYYPENLYQVVKKKQINTLHIKVFMYQMLRALNYLKIIDIAHRDIKPHNILVDRSSNRVVICDFGSAKQLVKGEPNLAYICSRCYRAPQLIFGATSYTTQIDMWSLGCVLVQMINGEPPFIGDSQMDQLIEIIKNLGTPSWEDVGQMNPKYSKTQYSKFPYVKATEWKNSLRTKDQKLIDLVSRILCYSPIKRLSPVQALLHPFFDQLRNQAKFEDITKKLIILPQMFNFTKQQIDSFGLYKQGIIPFWNFKKNAINFNNGNSRGIQKGSTSKNTVGLKKSAIKAM